ncbi:PREDICTED: nucleolar and spindle-associated protein 1-like [Elephantulus edwardii]|uniref:nucleolar and spindle-associated protein 1-like n=1 Tax=Elephantulus edwardii TaxID=28737 RepID=UPI0003F0E249|nr:PREDICTED: nucleolar and spindle-associated protein 1-like [Elephantulus edwardii]
MTAHVLEDLDSFKYSDLQNLAKSLGLRANLKADKLLKTLKAHLQQEARKENENEDQSPITASSCDESVTQIKDEEQAEKNRGNSTTQCRRRRRTVKGNTDAQDHSELKKSAPAEFQNEEQRKDEQELGDKQELGIVGDAPPSSAENADPLEKNKTNDLDNEDSKAPVEKKKSLCTDGSSKGRKNKTTGSTTPNFKKLHAAHFKEMESIDQYVERKRKHFEEHRNSLNELKVCAFHPLQKQPAHKKMVLTPVMMTPVPLRKRPSVAHTPSSQQCWVQGTARQSILCPKRSVKTSAVSATKMNVRFSAATKDNEHKRSLTKTPARKSPHMSLSRSTPKSPAVLSTHKLNTTDPASVITPFKLTVETPVSNKKPVFDLKASLSRPLTYEPHRGKLKPWGQSKENNSLNEYVTRVSFHKKTYKQPHLQTREEKRKKHEQERKEKKEKVLEARRGFNIAAN